MALLDADAAGPYDEVRCGDFQCSGFSVRRVTSRAEDVLGNPRCAKCGTHGADYLYDWRPWPVLGALALWQGLRWLGHLPWSIVGGPSWVRYVEAVRSQRNERLQQMDRVGELMLVEGSHERSQARQGTPQHDVGH